MIAVQELVVQIKTAGIQAIEYLQALLYAGGDIAVLAVILLIGVFAGMILYHLVVINYKNYRVKRTFKSGRIAENAAVKFLRSHGYKILASQLREEVIIYVDGEAEKSIVRADYLVRRGWKLYVVEVKSGQQGNAKLPTIRQAAMQRLLWKK